MGPQGYVLALFICVAAIWSNPAGADTVEIFGSRDLKRDYTSRPQAYTPAETIRGLSLEALPPIPVKAAETKPAASTSPAPAPPPSPPNMDSRRWKIRANLTLRQVVNEWAQTAGYAVVPYDQTDEPERWITSFDDEYTGSFIEALYQLRDAFSRKKPMPTFELTIDRRLIIKALYQ